MFLSHALKKIVKWSKLEMFSGVRKCGKCGKAGDRQCRFYLNNPVLTVVREKVCLFRLSLAIKIKSLQERSQSMT